MECTDVQPKSIAPADLGVSRLLALFAILSLVLLGLLAAAPARGYFTEWRAAQERYAALAKHQGLPDRKIAIQQIWQPEIDAVDRCGSCHLAAAGIAMQISDEPLFRAHPPLPHDPREIGCTICHGGQGRATSRTAAHGNVAHWYDPLLAKSDIEAGCGTCHLGILVPRTDAAEKGRAVFDSQCVSCHRAGDGGKKDGVDLQYIGLRGFRGDWHTWHIQESANAKSGAFLAGFAPLADDEISAVEEYLRSLVGAPRLLAGKGLSVRYGCRGCHKINGTGGDDGPDLSDEGRRSTVDLDFSHVQGERTLVRWLTEHFLDPARVSEGSRMPKLGASEEEARALSLYMLSLRRRPVAERFEPRDRVRVTRLGERDFAGDGPTLYGAFCSGCHGLAGEGRKLGDQFASALANPELLAVLDDAFLRKAIGEGRSGRRMPAWMGLLGAQEIDVVIGFLRSREPVAPTFEAVEATPIDAELGRTTYRTRCAPCHGELGEGSELAPPLAAPDNVVNKADDRVYGTLSAGVQGTAMGSFKALDAGSMHAVIAHVRALPSVNAEREKWAPKAGDAGRGETVFAASCAKCHGDKGEGREGPALRNPALLSAMSDGQMAATIIRGRSGTTMPAFGAAGPDWVRLGPDHVQDVIAFIRSKTQ
jgi:mono/diheme cytochrome c family protein